MQVQESLARVHQQSQSLCPAYAGGVSSELFQHPTLQVSDMVAEMETSNRQVETCRGAGAG